LRAALFTKEFPPLIYGGAGVHVDYLSRELARKIDVEVHCWGKQHADLGRLHVRGQEPWDQITHGTTGKFKGALEALSLNLTQVKALEAIDICHTHTWYVSMAGFLAAGACGIYNTTKFAVRGMSASLRASLAQHQIGVSVLCPGLVKSYIYASDEVRPAGLKAGAKPVDSEAVKRLAALHEFGMEPDVIAARVIDAMREDRFHIFSHPEFKDELSEVFAETLEDFRDYPVDPGHVPRVDFEKTRRESYRQQRRGLKGP